MFNGHMTNNNSASSALRKRKDSMLTGGYGFVDPNYLPKTLRGLVLNNGLGHRDSIDEESLPQILGERKPTPQCLEEMLPGVKLDREHFSTVLVLYTGGTIGMKSVNGGMCELLLLFPPTKRYLIHDCLCFCLYVCMLAGLRKNY